jgi:hypothetical protein
VEGDEVAPESVSPCLVETGCQCFGWTITVDESIPGRGPIGFAVVGNALFKLELEVAAKQLFDARCLAPFER